MDADDYIDMFEWSTWVPSDLPLTKHLTNDQIAERIKTGGPGDFVEEFPCHTQAVERAVKMVTEAAASVCGEDARHGFFLAMVQSRKEIPEFQKKSDFVVK